jgi:metal-responsive CopG/Arc/MetJ family transcriptional regulator
MPSAKIAITLQQSFLHKIDRLVRQKVYPNRSKAIQDAVAEKIQKIDRHRLSRECGKLDPEYEQKLAEEGMDKENEQWPEY